MEWIEDIGRPTTIEEEDEIKQKSTFAPYHRNTDSAIDELQKTGDSPWSKQRRRNEEINGISRGRGRRKGRRSRAQILDEERGGVLGRAAEL